jgi:hypothetical protein
MKKQVMVCFEYENEDGLKKYEKAVEFPDEAPVPFSALCAFGYYVFWQEKLALKARIEELEAKLDAIKAAHFGGAK